MIPIILIETQWDQSKIIFSLTQSISVVVEEAQGTSMQAYSEGNVVVHHLELRDLVVR
jgi:hypothetical protein